MAAPRGPCLISRRRFTAVLGVAAALAAILIAASQVGARDARRPVVSPAQATLFVGIEQRGAALGSPHAPVTLVEYADLQCPYCAQWSRHALPALVSDYVRTGRVRIVFRGLAFLGADSELALRMVIAARAQNKQWDLLHELYARQEYENSGWVSDELDRAAGSAGVDTHSLERIAWSRSTTRAIARDSRAAQLAGVRGTPSFEVGRTGGPMHLVHVGSLDAAGIRPELDTAPGG